MKEKEIKIDSVNLKIGNREICLTIDECKKPHDSLNDLFGKRISFVDRWYWTYQTISPVVTYGAGSTFRSNQYTFTTNNALVLDVK